MAGCQIPLSKLPPDEQEWARKLLATSALKHGDLFDDPQSAND
jgi:hypothetical protein